MTADRNSLLIGIVGPCGAGKSTLIANLALYGLATRHIAQEHSYVADMWQRITHPDVLIFLDASFEMATQRRRLNWRREDYDEQQHRLRHARKYAHLYLDTTEMTPDEVRDAVLAFLNEALQKTP